MQTLRAFIAVALSPFNRAAIAKTIRRLETVDGGIKWVDPDQLHLTLHFLGDVQFADVKPVCEVVREAVADFAPFGLHLGGIGAFPDQREPRVIWLGIRLGHERLVSLQQTLDEPLAALGYPSDRTRFRPHVTIGRVKRVGNPEAIRSGLEAMSEVDAGSCAVDEITIFQSDIERRGPIYTPLAEIELGWR